MGSRAYDGQTGSSAWESWVLAPEIEITDDNVQGRMFGDSTFSAIEHHEKMLGPGLHRLMPLHSRDLGAVEGQ